MRQISFMDHNEPANHHRHGDRRSYRAIIRARGNYSSGRRSRRVPALVQVGNWVLMLPLPPIRPTGHYRPAWSHQIVRCRCGWSGPWCEAEHGYRGDNMCDVYGVTECPECGREL